MAAFIRSDLRIDHTEAQQGMTPQHRVRPLMPEDTPRSRFDSFDVAAITALTGNQSNGRRRQSAEHDKQAQVMG
jgi:hypothetical protein